MSQTLYIGINKKQLQNLINGTEIGKRPYAIGDTYFAEWKSPTSKKYEGDLRIFIRVLSDDEEKKEHEGAFF